MQKAVKDESLVAQVTERIPLVYREGPSDSEDRPPFVRAASGLGTCGEYLLAVQDDANWLAIIDGEQTVHAIPLPRGPGGARLCDDERGNAADKADLEACIVLPDKDGFELVAFGSGTADARQWILRAHCTDARQAVKSRRLEARFCAAADFYAQLQRNREFSGGSVNIEGAVALDGDRILLLQRGNAKPGDGDAVDATAEISWSELRAYLDGGAGPPSLRRVTPYELGTLDGVRLTFSDAEHLGGGRILYSASAERMGPGEDGEIAGSVLGIIEADGSARWTEVLDEQGRPFTSKIEGLTLDPARPSCVRFVIDDDDADAPSELFLAEIGGSFVSAE